MELEELSQRLLPFARHHYGDETVTVTDVFKMPGHAGFAYGFSVVPPTSEAKHIDKWYIRLPPPNVKLQGTADVLRQVAALDVLPKTVPHCSVKWSGDDPQWFGRPYFVVPQLEGDVVRAKDDWILDLAQESRVNMARQAVNALVEIHKVDYRLVEYLGEPISLESDIERWDRFVEKAADPEKLSLVPEVKRLLLENIPKQVNIGIFHGDFQWSNLFYSEQAQLLAVIDWELVGVGATLNDLGWFATFNDPEAWADSKHSNTSMPLAEELIAMYEEAWGSSLPEVAWFRALAAYKFAIITGFNLMLHRRGKRHDPLWETTKDSMESLLARAHALLS
jgi:aminoglycoside phosphotransferase (APT) family kinase protein